MVGTHMEVDKDQCLVHTWRWIRTSALRNSYAYAIPQVGWHTERYENEFTTCKLIKCIRSSNKNGLGTRLSYGTEL